MLRVWHILLVVLGVCGLGVYNYRQLPIDAVPDITNVQVQINTEAPGYSPLEAEQRVLREEARRRRDDAELADGGGARRARARLKPRKLL